MIDQQGISTGKDIRELTEVIENDLLLNYRKFFSIEKDKPINEVDFKEWEENQIKRYNQFKEDNVKIVNRHIKTLHKAIRDDLKASYEHGVNVTDKRIKQATGKGFKPQVIPIAFYTNDRITKMLNESRARVNTTLGNAVKYVNDQYLITLNNIKLHTESSNTLYEAVDKANKQLLEGGISGGTTINGRNIHMTNSIELYHVEASQDMMFQGNADKRSEAGIYTVYVTAHASTCELCTPWQEQILIDDVFQNGTPDGKHELVSTAISQGWGHYNCRCNLVTFIEGYDTFPNKPVNVPEKKSDQHALYHAEQRQRQIERNIRKYKRKESLALSKAEHDKARKKVLEWQLAQRNQIRSTKGLYRNNWREQQGWKMPRDYRWLNMNGRV